MRIGVNGFCLLTLAAVLTVGAVKPASAEFFGCNDRRGQVLYTYNGSPSQYGGRHTSNRYTNDFAAQSRTRYTQPHASYVGSRRYTNDRSRW